MWDSLEYTTQNSIKFKLYYNEIEEKRNVICVNYSIRNKNNN